MNPKLEIILTYLISVFAFIANIKAITGDAQLFNILFLVVNTILWFISATIKLYKYKKNKNINWKFKNKLSLNSSIKVALSNLVRWYYDSFKI